MRLLAEVPLRTLMAAQCFVEGLGHCMTRKVMSGYLRVRWEALQSMMA
jgi:hypothetical protein